MARLRRQSPVDNDRADDADFEIPRQVSTTRLRSSPRRKQETSYADNDDLDYGSDDNAEQTLTAKILADTARSKRQIKLASLKASESTSELRQKITAPERTRRRPLKDVSGNGKKSTSPGLPKLNAFGSIPDLKPSSLLVNDEQEVEDDVEESVWCGSDASSEEGSEDELPSPRKLWPTKAAKAPAPKTASNSLDEALQGFQGLSINEPKTKEAAKTVSTETTETQTDHRPSSSHDKDDLDAILRFSPPRLITRPREKTPERPVTPPPASPSKSRLVSPSKTRIRIPSPPLRQSLDGFWDSHAVNDWNDQHSPRKTIKSPKKNAFTPDSGSTSPTSSPKKSSSPTKRSTADIQAKKDFSARKHALAEAFLAELDQTITTGQIASLSASTGGVRLLWNKTLNSTAGRANWRRETSRSQSAPTTHKHHASIELAEKVIDDEHRLLNVLAHEFCHLANFMISGVKDQPHGASFKAWGKKCTAAFGARGVQVTTKHSYTIDYKYVWRCEGEGCWAEFKRHSKSIDPARHTCGGCKSKLVQVKPVPRGGGAVVGGKVGGYAGFVKMHFAEVKKSLPAGSSQKEVMEAVGRKYREEKEAKAKAEAAGETIPGGNEGGLDDLTRALDVIGLDD